MNKKYYCTYCGNYYDEMDHLEDCAEYKLKQLQAENNQLREALERIEIKLFHSGLMDNKTAKEWREQFPEFKAIK